jgi:glycosyltransferase involved in cell wall biosynthesis
VLVSVVIPCYRQAHFLAEAIESARHQTYPAVEIVVVNDGSPDDTAMVAARYPEVRYVEQANAGLAAARNTGLAHSTGGFVVFLDADDRLLPDALRANAERLAADPSLGFVAGRSYYVASDGAPIPTDQRPQPEGDLYVALLRRNRIRMPAMVMFRRSVFDAVGTFDTDIDACADYDIYLRVCRAYRVAFHDAVVAEYRRHGGNMSLNEALMLRQLSIMLRRRRRELRSGVERDAWRHGRRNIRDYYGDLLANRLRSRFRSRRQWGQTLSDAWTLMVHHPRGFTTHVGRALANSVRRMRGAGDPPKSDVILTRPR